jgi:hypothetical protein
MKRLALLTALLISTAAVGAAAAASDSESPPAPESRAGHPTRVAEGFFEGLWGERQHGERHGHPKRHWGDDDDDDDEGEAREGRGGGASGQADPNAANAPVPDNGVFTGKARPKVEVQ